MDDSKEKMSSRSNRTKRTYEPNSLQQHTHDLHTFKPDGVLALRGRSGYGIQSRRIYLQMRSTGKGKIILFPMVSHCLYYQPFIKQALCPGVGGKKKINKIKKRTQWYFCRLFVPFLFWFFLFYWSSDCFYFCCMGFYFNCFFFVCLKTERET